MNLERILGIVMIVFGVLLLIGEFSLGALLPYAGIVLIVLGILMLIKTLPGGLLMGIIVLVVGILLLEGFLDLPDSMRVVTRVINIIAGVVLIILGIMKLR